MSGLEENKHGRKVSKRKFKINRIAIVLTIIVIITTIGIAKANDGSKRLSGGEKESSHVVINKSYDAKSKLKTIEINAVNENLNSIIVTNTMIDKMKSNNIEYAVDVSAAFKSNKISSRDIYNINKAIELGLINENTKLTDYYWKVSGFTNQDQFVEFCENTFKSMET